MSVAGWLVKRTGLAQGIRHGIVAPGDEVKVAVAVFRPGDDHVALAVEGHGRADNLEPLPGDRPRFAGPPLRESNQEHLVSPSFGDELAKALGLDREGLGHLGAAMLVSDVSHPDVALSIGDGGGEIILGRAVDQGNAGRDSLGFHPAAQEPVNRSVGELGQADIELPLIGRHREDRLERRLERDDHPVGGHRGPEGARPGVPDSSGESDGPPCPLRIRRL